MGYRLCGLSGRTGRTPEGAARRLPGTGRLAAVRATAAVSADDVRRRAAAIAGRQLSSATRAYYLGLAAFEGDTTALLHAITPVEVEAVQRRVFGRPLAALIVE